MAAPQLLVFDARRGNREGREEEKVLAFHPAEAPLVDQITLAGLLQGLLLFSSNFSQDCWEVAETDKTLYVAHQPEPSIWFALAAPRTWLPRHCGERNLQAALVQAYQIVSLLHGPLEPLLQQDASGATARRALLPTLEHLGRQLASPTTWQHRQLRNPLCDVALAPTLRTLSPTSALAIQDFCNMVQLMSLGGTRRGSRDVEGLVLVQQQHVLWSTLTPAEGAAVHSLAATALLHPQSPGQRSAAGEASQPNILDSSCWHQLPSKFVVLRPGCWREGPQLGDGSSAAPEEVALVPTAFIQGGQERCHLLPYKEGKLWLLLLVSARLALTQGALATLQAALAAPAQALAAQVGQELRAMPAEAGHVPGYRYLYCDRPGGTATATPRVKISAMLHHSRALAASVRESLARLEPAHNRGAVVGSSSASNGYWAELDSGDAQAPAAGSGSPAAAWGGIAAAPAQQQVAEAAEELQQLGLQQGGQGQQQQGEEQGKGPAAEVAEGGDQATPLQGANSANAAAAVVAPPFVTPPPAVGANDVREVFVRSNQDVWAAARAGPRGERQLLVVREKKKEHSLGEAAAAVDAFADTLLPC